APCGHRASCRGAFSSKFTPADARQRLALHGEIFFPCRDPGIAGELRRPLVDRRRWLARLFVAVAFTPCISLPAAGPQRRSSGQALQPFPLRLRLSKFDLRSLCDATNQITSRPLVHFQIQMTTYLGFFK